MFSLPDLTTTFLIAQIFALVASGASLIAPQFKNERTLLMVQLPAGLCWACYYTLMGGITGAIIALINVTRNSTCLFLPKRFHKLAVVIAISCILFSATMTWAGWHSALPIMASLFTGIPLLYQQRHITLRLCLIMSSCCWLTYELTIGAYIAAITSIFLITSGLIGLARKYLLIPQPKIVATE